MKFNPLYPLAAVALFAACISCATPVPPTGGPPDTTAPVIVETDPENETVNFDGREVRITFSKFINRASLLDAIEIEPDLAIGYDVRWRRRTAFIEFERDLPENTTVIIRIGTELQDSRSNNLTSQFSLAISTGDEIDNGSVAGRIRQAEDGSTDSGLRIFLYREPFDLSDRASYIAETDTSGRVQFSHLAADAYKAIWVDDANRNRIWDSGREPAQPFYDSTFTLERGGEFDLGTIYVHRPDTARPQLQGVGLLTEERLRLRFNEDVFWEDESVIQINDSLGNSYTEAFPLYAVPEDPQVVIAQSAVSLPEDQRFSVELLGFADEAGNAPQINMDPFPGSAQPDTVRLRIIGDNLDPGLFPDEPVIIGYNKLIDDEDITDSLRVVEGERMIDEWPGVQVDRHRLLIPPWNQWESGIIYQILVWNPDTELLRPFEPDIWHRNQWGTIDVILADTTNTEEHFFTLFDNEGKIHIDTTFTRHLEIDQLPPLSYTAVIFRDENQSGDWNTGTIIPFQAPEPYFVRRNIPVREGFTSELDVSFEE